MTQAITRPEVAGSITKADAIKAIIHMKDGKLVPEDIEGVFRLSKFIMVAKMQPRGVENESQMALMLVAGFELGLSLGQILKGMMIVNNRPSVWGDVAMALVIRSSLCADFAEFSTGEGDQLVATCAVKRKGWAEGGIARTFSVADAKKAGLWGKTGPWTNYPKRMLQMRARGYAIRDAFADLLGGLDIIEEVMDIQTFSATAATTTPSGEPERVALPDVPEEATAPLAGEDEAQRAKDADGASFLESLNQPPVGTVGHKK
jgi:hypothetical protein